MLLWAAAAAAAAAVVGAKRWRARGAVVPRRLGQKARCYSVVEVEGVASAESLIVHGHAMDTIRQPEAGNQSQ